MTALPNKNYSGHCRDIEVEGDQRTCGKEIGERNVDSRFQVRYSWRKMEAALYIWMSDFTIFSRNVHDIFWLETCHHFFSACGFISHLT